MREIEITENCLEFIDTQSKRVSLKFFQLIEVITEVKIINSNFVKKLQSTPFYELRIKAGNEYRVILFALDHLNFNECKKVVCLNGFQKKSIKDYKKAIRIAEGLLEEYLSGE
jgi:hypothetical protein